MFVTTRRWGNITDWLHVCLHLQWCNKYLVTNKSPGFKMCRKKKYTGKICNSIKVKAIILQYAHDFYKYNHKDLFSIAS